VSAYAVTALDARGGETLPTRAARDTIDVPPLLEIRPGAGIVAAETTSVRAVRVAFFSERAERLFLASAADSLAPRGLAAPESFPPSLDGYPWTLTAGPGPEATKTVFGRALRSDGSLSAITFDTIRQNAIRLDLLVNGSAADTVRTGRRALTVSIVSAVGADSIQMTIDPAPYPPWSPFAPAAVLAIPADSTGRPARLRQTLRVRAKNDFGVVDSARVVVEVDTLAGARILLNAGAAQTSGAAVTVTLSAGIATAICLTNDSTAAASAGACRAASGFEAFDGAREAWPLEPSQRGGFARVFGFAANEWDTTAMLVDSIYFLP
jgi:hypothetical protein